VSDTADDAVLEAIVESVSRAIDDFCGRRFYAATETRYYTARKSRRLLVDDLLSITTLKTDDDADGTYETTWAATDYNLAPYNAQLAPVPEPYWEIEVSENGDYWFPTGTIKGVQVVGSWGFSATTPDVINRSCLFQVAQEFRTRHAPLGIQGSGDMQVEIRGIGLHPFVKRLLSTGPYRRIDVS
jgi:hypothetical protein